MSSTYGNHLKLSIFGQSHGSAIGMVLDAIPAGLPVDMEKLQNFLNRRAPGQNSWSTPRREEDRPEFLGGILDGFTCGAPIAAVIHNHNTRSADYQKLKDCPRPGHADYTAQVKYGGFQDSVGGGHFSGRLTAPLCIAGGLCLQWLQESEIDIAGHIIRIGNHWDDRFDPISPEMDRVDENFPVLNREAGAAMQDEIAAARSRADSLGGFIECAVTGLPAGVGEPMFDGLESRIAQIVYGIPAVKSLSFGDVMEQPQLLGSYCNDSFAMDGDRVVTQTNHCGGILGGISNGMPLIFRVGIKPTPSIAREQQTVDLLSGNEICVRIPGRHDPCIVPRAVPVIEAAAAIAIFDLLLGNSKTDRRK